MESLHAYIANRALSAVRHLNSLQKRKNKTFGMWLIIAVALGLIVFSLTGILVNGFKIYLLYPIALGLVNLVAYFLIK